MTPIFSLQSRDYLNTPERKRHYNAELFTEVAPRYDVITRLLSLGRDSRWKRRLVAALPPMAPRRALDLACGTGDLARLIHDRFPKAEVTGIDLTPAMVTLARHHTSPGLSFEVGDMDALPFPAASMDLVTGGYALRNAPDLGRALDEVCRVLRPGGVCAFLDFGKSPHPAAQRVAHLILKTWGGWWGLVLHRHADVYGYIAESLARFPDRVRLRTLLTDRGLIPMTSQTAFGGMIEWIVCQKS